MLLNSPAIVSRLELARSYAAKLEWPEARALLKSIGELPVQFSDDAKHKQQALAMLEDLRTVSRTSGTAIFQEEL